MARGSLGRNACLIFWELHKRLRTYRILEVVQVGQKRKG
jgi:hypothetical protein